MFYLKMKGDYYRYMAEIAKEEDRFGRNYCFTGFSTTLSFFLGVVDLARDAYMEALDIATEQLKPTNSIRLSLVLSVTVFYSEIIKSVTEAAQLTQQVAIF